MITKIDENIVYSLNYLNQPIYCLIDGTIKIGFNLTTILTDSTKKDIKLHPKNKSLFTTVDDLFGLRVWNLSKLIYTYKYSALINHHTSSTGTIAALSNCSIKLIDLRDKYCYENICCLNAKQCYLEEPYIYYCTDTSLIKMDLRNKKFDKLNVQAKKFFKDENFLYFLAEKKFCKMNIDFNTYVQMDLEGSLLCKLKSLDYDVVVTNESDLIFIGKKEQKVQNVGDKIGVLEFKSENEIYFGTSEGLFLMKLV